MARPSHKPTDELRKRVKTLAGFGLNIEQIGHVIGLDRHTVSKHYREELRSGKSEALAICVNSLFANIKKGNVAAQIFYLKTQARWTETERHEVSGPEGGPIETKFVDAPPQETREQWESRRKKEINGNLGSTTGATS